MPTSNFRRIDLDLLYPAFLEKVLDAVAACEARGAHYIATRGYDTYGAQMALWAQGRTKPGPVVTNAKGGQSQHNFGLAVDFARVMPDGKVSWDAADYQPLIEEVEKRGLHSGRGYKDVPHVGWPGLVNAEQLLPLHLAWEKSQDTALGTLDRLKEVWKAVEQKGHG